MTIAKNIARVHERMESAAKRVGRSADDVALMAVTKTMGATPIRQAYEAGLRLFGENRVQEFTDKFESICDLPNVEWRLIGHLQSNKAAKAAGMFTAIDTIDSLRVAERVNAAAEKLGKIIPVLIEVNVGGEEAKAGVQPVSSEFEQILRAAPSLEALRIRGLMTVPPMAHDPEEARPYFRMMAKVRDEIAARHLPGVSMEELSMGMSHDFEVAIEEGSTCVRVGTAIFGVRPESKGRVA
ncbi:MAG TPA: YggS family pyridoxal phosphate-dependent enzyme [Terriglobales bacterium]|nr:YggS family pyridoxal phosphate-dependent enzyme [Terriglobales bacterium]